MVGVIVYSTIIVVFLFVFCSFTFTFIFAFESFLAKASNAAASAPALTKPVVRRASATWPMPESKPTTLFEDGENLEGGVRKQRKKGEVKFVLLSVLSFDSEPLADIRLKVKALGYDLSYDRVRTQLWSFKNDGLVESPEKGHYCWTEKGAAYVQSHKGESPVDAGLSSATMSGQDEL